MPMGALLLLFLLFSATPTAAQSSDNSSSPVRKPIGMPTVVKDALPELQVQLGCQEPPDNRANQQFTLYENGRKVTLLASVEPAPFYPETQIIFLFDLVEGSERLLPELADLLNRFLVAYSKSDHSVTTNQFAAYMPAEDGNTLVEVSDFSQQVITLIDGVNRAQLQAPAATALAALLKNGADEFYQRKPIRRTIVLFSDGLDTKTQNELPTVLADLRNQQIVVYPIFIPTTEKGAPENLQQIASMTGGERYEISQQEAVNALLLTLVKPAYRCTLRYRTTSLQPIHLAVQEMISGTIVTTTTMDVPAIKASPPTVTIETTQFLTDIVQSPEQDPVPLLIKIRWNFPNYEARQVKAIAYTLSNASRLPVMATRIITQNVSADQFQLLVPAAGRYNLEVAVEDEFHLRGRDNVPFAIVPPTFTPTPTPLPTATVTPIPVPTLSTLQAIDAGIAAQVQLSSLVFSASTLFLLAVLIPLFVWLVRALTKLRERGTHPAPTTAAKEVTALLYRVQSRPEYPLRQVVPLHDEALKLPDALLVQAKPTVHAKNLEKISDLTNFHVRIQKHGRSQFELIYTDQMTALVKLHSDGVVEDLPTDRLTVLTDQTIIQLGQVQYRFIDLVNRTKNGFYPTNLTTPSQQATP